MVFVVIIVIVFIIICLYMFFPYFGNAKVYIFFCKNELFWLIDVKGVKVFQTEVKNPERCVKSA